MAAKPSTTLSETSRIADQLRRAFEGRAWHGPSLFELLRNVGPSTAAAKPLPNAHSIWELVLHIAAWDEAVRRRLGGAKLKVTALQNFPRVPEPPTHRDSARSEPGIAMSPATATAFCRA